MAELRTVTVPVAIDYEPIAEQLLAIEQWARNVANACVEARVRLNAAKGE